MNQKWLFCAAAALCAALLAVPTFAAPKSPTLSGESTASGSVSIYEAVRPVFSSSYRSHVKGNVVYIETSDRVSDDAGRYYRIVDSGMLADPSLFSCRISVSANPQVVESVRRAEREEGGNCFAVTLSPDYVFEQVSCELDAVYTAKQDLALEVVQLGVDDPQQVTLTVKKGAKLSSGYRLQVDGATVFL